MAFPGVVTVVQQVAVPAVQGEPVEVAPIAVETEEAWGAAVAAIAVARTVMKTLVNCILTDMLRRVQKECECVCEDVKIEV